MLYTTYFKWKRPFFWKINFQAYTVETSRCFYNAQVEPLKMIEYVHERGRKHERLDGSESCNRQVDSNWVED